MKTRHSTGQIVAKLRQAEAALGKGLKVPEKENAGPKKLVVELSLDSHILKEADRSRFSGARRNA